jgi:hypothetical protein
MEYPKIETLFDRDPITFKVLPGNLRKPVYGTINSWQWTEKVDGTNIRIIWTPAKDGVPERMSIGGKTDNAQVHTDLVRRMYDLVSAEKMRAVFPDAPVTIYGEGYGAGIQKGGVYSPTKQFVAFDILVDGKWWLDWENTVDVARKLGLPTVPFIAMMPLDVAVDMVREGFRSELANDNGMPETPAEGLVGRTLEPLFDKRGHRLIIKLKTKDF